MDIHIIGAGAIGKLLAARLSEVARPLLVTHTSEQAALIQSEGLLYAENDGVQQRRLALNAMDSACYLTELHRGSIAKADCILLTVKQGHINQSLIQMLQSGLGRHGLIACWQNGIGHLEYISQEIDSGQVIAAVTTEGARSDQANSVTHTGAGWTKLGSHIESWPLVTKERLKALEESLKQAGFTVMLSNEITNDVWNKLTINSIINPLTAMYGLLNGDLVASPFLLRIMRDLLDEAVAVANSAGVQTDPLLWDLLLEVCRRTAGNLSSMLQDIRAGRPTEIEWINGSILRTARKYGLVIPTQETVYRAISEKRTFP